MQAWGGQVGVGAGKQWGRWGRQAAKQGAGWGGVVGVCGVAGGGVGVGGKSRQSQHRLSLLGEKEEAERRFSPCLQQPPPEKPARSCSQRHTHPSTHNTTTNTEMGGEKHQETLEDLQTGKKSRSMETRSSPLKRIMR